MKPETESLLVDRFDDLAARSASRLAVKESEYAWSYADLAVRSCAISDALRETGIAAGDCVALMLPNGGAFVASFYGIARLRASVAPLNPRYREQELDYYLKSTGAAALVVADGLLPRSESISDREDAPAVVEVDTLGRCVAVWPGRQPSTAAGSAEDPILLHQYTSGSTGPPKRILRRDSMLRKELGRLAAAFSLTEEDRFLGAAPFSHVNGLVRTLLTSMNVGGTLYPVANFQRRPILDLIGRERITYFGAVPYMFAILAETRHRAEVDLSSLRIAFSASAPLRIEDNRAFAERYGLFIRQLYGSTETGTISVNREAEPEGRLGSVGTPLEGVRIEILDEERRPLPPGVEGEISIQSPWAIGAYDGNPEATAASFRDGVYYSGDLGHVDEEGFLTLTGRLKFLINRSGYKVNPMEVEQAIQSHPKVSEVVVLGAPSRFGDEVVRCVVLAREPCTADEIVEHCRSRIADFKIPSRIEFRDALPKSAAGKILRHEL